MEYIAILALAVWVWAMSRRLEAMRGKIETLETRIRALAAEREPLLLDTVMIGPVPAEVEQASVRQPASFAPVLSAAARHWRWFAGAGFLCLFTGYLYALGAGNLTLAAAYLLAASSAALLLGWRREVALATVTLCITGVLQIWIWPLAAPGSPAVPFTSSMLQIVWISYATRRRWSQASAFVAHAAGVLLGVAGYFNTTQVGLTAFLSALVLAAALALGSFLAKPHRRERSLMAFAGAWSATLLCAIAAFAGWTSLSAAAALAIGAAALGGLSAVEVGRTAARTPWPAAWWMSAAATLLILLLHQVAPGPASGAAAALLALGCAAFGRQYPALRAAACVSALLALLHVVMVPPSNWGAAASAVIAAAALSVSARLARDHPVTGDWLDAAAWGAVVALAFAGIQANTTGAFTRAALEASTLIAVALLASPPGVSRTKPRRQLGMALVGLGFVLALGQCGFTYNPWWGEAPAQIGGPPILDAIALAFAAPAGLALLAARRWRTESPRFARWCLAVAAGFALLWIVLELRRILHGAHMATAPLTFVEGLAYIAVLGGFFGAARTGMVRRRLLAFTQHASAQ